MPNSVDLAAASKTNTKNISNIPTIIEKDPKIENIVVTPEATVSANLTPLFFESSTLNVVKSPNIINNCAASTCKPALSKAPRIINCN